MATFDIENRQANAFFLTFPNDNARGIQIYMPSWIFRKAFATFHGMRKRIHHMAPETPWTNNLQSQKEKQTGGGAVLGAKLPVHCEDKLRI